MPSCCNDEAQRKESDSTSSHNLCDFLLRLVCQFSPILHNRFHDSRCTDCHQADTKRDMPTTGQNQTDTKQRFANDHLKFRHVIRHRTDKPTAHVDATAATTAAATGRSDHVQFIEACQHFLRCTTTTFGRLRICINGICRSTKELTGHSQQREQLAHHVAQELDSTGKHIHNRDQSLNSRSKGSQDVRGCSMKQTLHPFQRLRKCTIIRLAELIHGLP